MLKINVTDTYAQIVEGGIIPSGSVKSKSVIFSFSPEWEAYGKTVTFVGSGNTVSLTSVQGGRPYPIPYEVLEKPGSLKIVIFGVSGNAVMPVIYTYAEVRDSGMAEGETPSEPTPTVYQQLVNEVNEAKPKYTNFNDYLMGVAPEGAILTADETYQLIRNQIVGIEATPQVEGMRANMFYNGTGFSLRVLPSEGTLEEVCALPLLPADRAIPSARAVKDYIDRKIAELGANG